MRIFPKLSGTNWIKSCCSNPSSFTRIGLKPTLWTKTNILEQNFAEVLIAYKRGAYLRNRILSFSQTDGHWYWHYNGYARAHVKNKEHIFANQGSVNHADRRCKNEEEILKN